MSSRPAPEDPARMPYSRPDADGFDGIRASGHEARFEAKFGPRPDAIALRRTSLNVRRVARGNFFSDHNWPCHCPVDERLAEMRA